MTRDELDNKVTDLIPTCVLLSLFCPVQHSIIYYFIKLSQKIGRIHLGKQDIEKMNVKKAKAIKRKSDVGKDKDGKPTKRVKTGAELESYEERSSNV